MTFTNEGNRTFIDNLVNFEKMVRPRTFRLCQLFVQLKPFMSVSDSPALQRMIANTVKIVRYCRSQSFSKSENVGLIVNIQAFLLLTDLSPPLLWHSSSLQFESGPESPQANKNQPEVRRYVRQLNVIDNQRTLTQLSHGLEPRRAWTQVGSETSKSNAAPLRDVCSLRWEGPPVQLIPVRTQRQDCFISHWLQCLCITIRNTSHIAVLQLHPLDCQVRWRISFITLWYIYMMLYFC